MTAVKSDLQKLQNLLNSATNARQRKMYQSLLEKALKDASNQKKVSKQAANIDTIPKTTVPPANKNKQVKTEILKVSELKTPTKDNGNKPSTENSEKIPTQQDNKINPNLKSPLNDSSFFQAVGLIKCTPQIKDDTLYIAIDGQEYDLRRGQWGARKNFDNLKLEIEQYGPTEKWLRVYPKIAHNQRERKIHYWFTLNKVISTKSKDSFQQQDFILRGIWHQVSYSSEPVISIFRNIEMLQHYKRTSTFAGKKAFARPQDFPVIWDAPIEPFQYNSKLDKKEQMPRYFVQVRAVFQDGHFKVNEMIQEPTTNIPRYIKPQINTSQPKTKQPK